MFILLCLCPAKQKIGIKHSKVIKNCATSAATSATARNSKCGLSQVEKYILCSKSMNWLLIVLVNVKPGRPLVSLLNMTERCLHVAMVDDED